MKRLLLMMVVILSSMTTFMLTSCHDDDDSKKSANVPDAESSLKELAGSWIVDLDGQDDADLAFMTLNITDDKKAEVGIALYDYDADDYAQESIKGTVNSVSEVEIDDRKVRCLEYVYDAESQQKLGVSGDEAKQVLYFTIEDGVCRILLAGTSQPLDADNDGQKEDFGNIMKSGSLDVSKLNKTASRRFINEMNEALGDDEAEEDASELKPQSLSIQVDAKHVTATGRSGKDWMKDVPDDRLVRNLLLPGSHDSGTCGMGPDWNITIGMTQRKSLGEQWDYGIRLFDLRARYSDADRSDRIYHSMLDCKMSLSSAINDIAAKLKEHKNTDGVVINISTEGNDIGVDEKVSVDVPKWDSVLRQHSLTKFQIDVRGFLQKAGDIGIYKFDFGKLDNYNTMNDAIYTIKKQLFDQGLLAKWTPDMTMKDLRGKVLIILDDNVSGIAYGPLADYIVIRNKGSKELFTPSNSAKAKYVEQNEYETPKDMKFDAYVDDKVKKFTQTFSDSKDRSQNYWVFNAANGYEFEFFIFPNYAKLAVAAYPKFKTAVTNNHGCRGMVLLDYAGDDKITRVNIYKVATNALVSIHPCVKIVEGLVNLVRKAFKKEADWLMTFKGIYYGLVKITPDDHVKSQELVGSLIEGNF